MLHKLKQALFQMPNLCKAGSLWLGLVVVLAFLTGQNVSKEQHLCTYITRLGDHEGHCEKKNLEKIPTLKDNIESLFFQHNRLEKLEANEFSNYKRLKKLDLENNSISKINRDAFQHVYLQELKLDNNKLDFIPMHAFEHAKSLRTLSLANNKIRNISRDAFIHLPNLVNLNLAGCLISSVHPLAFKNLTHLKTLSLVENRLNSLDPEMEKNLPASLSTFRVARNPWHCNCHLRWLRKWLKDDKINWDFDNTPVCAGPKILHNVKWKDLSPEKFVCASQIISNSSTIIELENSRNVTLVCRVYGDPDPTITWHKGISVLMKKPSPGHKYSLEQSGRTHITSILTIWDPKKTDTGDYKCIAKNSGGSAEVTYRVTIQPNGEDLDKESKKALKLSTELLIAICVAGGGFVLILIIIILCVIRYKDQRRHAYRVRDYKKDPKKKKKQESRASPPAEGLLDKKEEKRELLANDTKPSRRENPLHGPEKAESTSTDEYQFRMKIFMSGEKEPSSQMDSDREESGYDNPEVTKTERLKQNHINRGATPDLIRNGSQESSLAETQSRDSESDVKVVVPPATSEKQDRLSSSDRSTPDRIAEGIAKKLSAGKPVRFVIESEDSGSSDSDKLIKDRTKKPSPHKQKAPVSKAGTSGSGSGSGSRSDISRSRSDTESPSSELSVDSVIRVDQSGKHTVISKPKEQIGRRLPGHQNSSLKHDSSDSPHHSNPTSPMHSDSSQEGRKGTQKTLSPNSPKSGATSPCLPRAVNGGSPHLSQHQAAKHRPGSQTGNATSPKHIPNANTLPRSTSPRPPGGKPSVRSPVSPDQLRKPGAWVGCSPSTPMQPVHQPRGGNVPAVHVAQPVIISGARPDTVVVPASPRRQDKHAAQHQRKKAHAQSSAKANGASSPTHKPEKYPGVGIKDEFGTAV